MRVAHRCKMWYARSNALGIGIMSCCSIHTIPAARRPKEEGPLNENFIRIKALEGELKLSHKKRDFGLTVSTKELIYQKPHANYHIRLEDIISITPFELPVGTKPMRIKRESSSVSETVNMQTGMQHYRIHVKDAVVHNRSGMFSLGTAQFILPVLNDLLLAISKYGGLDAVT